MSLSMRMGSRPGLAGRNVLLLAITWLLVPSAWSSAILESPPLGLNLVAPLEMRFASRREPDLEDITGIIALGGSIDRMVKAARLAKLFPNAKVIIAGRGEEKSAALMRASGVSADRLFLETKSKSTFENATLTAAMVQPDQSPSLLLSLLHFLLQ